MKAVYFYACMLILLGACTKKERAQFELLDAKATGIDFINTITENDSFNILDYEYLYNGGGVAVADFDDDGLQDLFFTGNMVSNKLYHNLGNMKFEDVSRASGTEAQDFWCSGVSIIDINQDGKKDIYISTNTYKNSKRRTNLLFVNKTKKGGTITFEEQAQAYGIADTSYCMNSIFFDYDNDLDLDLLVITNKTQRRNDVSVYTRAKNDRASGNVDVLYRNDFDKAKGHAYFTDVSEEAGIDLEGFSLGVNVADFNEDGWKDIYISNDFISNDLLYINNKNGTFTNRLNEYVAHTCMSAMGNEVADVNNDGLLDIIALDMLPEDNFRKKTMMPANNYSTYVNNKDFNYTHQFTRNVLQLNRGYIPELGHNVYSDLAMLAGIEATDWSWSPLIADFDYDNDKDIIITNGFPKDVTDKDFMDYKSSNGAFKDKKDILSKIPEVKLKNYAFRNEGGLQFSNQTEQWGIQSPSFSNGAAYADLDNDGDVDYVVNNINDVSQVYQNTLINKQHSHPHYLKLRLAFQSPNVDAIGAVIKYKTVSAKSTMEFNPCRGYLSSMEHTLFIGMGKDSVLDLEIIWPNNSITSHQIDKVDTTLLISYEAAKSQPYNFTILIDTTIFAVNPNIAQDTFKDRDYIDFNFDPLLYSKKSNRGPGIAVGDVDKNSLQDYYITGAAGFSGVLYVQQANGLFEKKSLDLPAHVDKEQVDAAFIDIDNDGDEDLYIVCGTNQFNKSDAKLQDILLINDNGQWIDQSDLITWLPINDSCIKIADFDNDGDKDIFIGGESMPYFYPMNETSYLVRNDSDKGKIKMTLVKNDVFTKLGLVTDAVWIDYNKDGWLDLAVAREWNSILFLKNNNGQFSKDSINGVSNIKGWWNTIAVGDFNNDGADDIAVGNTGLNTIAKPSTKYPCRIYAKDFDGNSSYDFIPTTYFKDTKGRYAEVTYHTKGDMIKELNGFRKKFPSHTLYANAPLDSIIPSPWRKDALILAVNEPRTGIFINDGKGHFSFNSLPIEAQFAQVNDILICDYDNDGNKDMIVSGNNFGFELTTGKMDASIGCVFKGKGNGQFLYVPPSKSGLYFNNDARALSMLQNKNEMTIIQSANNGPVKAYRLNNYKTLFPKKEL